MIPHTRKNILQLEFKKIKMIKSRMRWAGHAAHLGDMRNSLTILVGKSQEKGPLWGLRRRWEDNIKVDLKEIR
jgi:hypothetical protein